nr:PREDICTED: short-chain dehydrogenase/reductase SDRA-like [Musa acuminata subsp. malaccensis]
MSKGIEVMGVVCHVSNPQHRHDLIEKTVQKYGHIGIVVSNAAANPSVDNILDTRASVLDKLWEISYLPQSSMAMYGVTKTALLELTKALAAEMSELSSSWICAHTFC